MKRTIAESIVNFLLGAAWAVVILGAGLFFWSFLPFGLVVASLAGFVGSFFGLFLVVLLEIAALQFEKNRLLERQTELLASIEKKLDAHDAAS